MRSCSVAFCRPFIVSALCSTTVSALIAVAAPPPASAVWAPAWCDGPNPVTAKLVEGGPQCIGHR